MGWSWAFPFLRVESYRGLELGILLLLSQCGSYKTTAGDVPVKKLLLRAERVTGRCSLSHTAAPSPPGLEA